MSISNDVSITPSSIKSGALTLLEKDKIEKIKTKLLKKKKEIRIKNAISKTFVFDESWQRKYFAPISSPDPHIEHFYNSDTFENQRDFGLKICAAFDDLNVTHILAIAPTQSGKTGSMLSIMREFNKKDAKHRVDAKNIFIFTGHSSTEWTNQTKKRFPASLENQIFHRNQLNKFIEMAQGKDNILIIFDESHIANKYGQTLYSLYNQMGLFNIKRLYLKNIKIVHFTATPDSLIQHADVWGNSLKVIHMDVPKNYISMEHYFNNNQVFECKPLLDNRDNILEILQHIDIADPFFHIIRTPRGINHNILMNQFRTIFKSFDFQYISEPKYNKLSSNTTNIYDLLNHKPYKHTFIFIVDKLRCAKSINIQHIQILYERFVSSPNYDSIIQGLFGRITGYHLHTSHIKLFTFKSIHLITNKSYNNIFLPF